MILVLALSPPGGPHAGLRPAVTPARGALMQLGEHPEWRQFLILAATRRADELSRLRDLPDTPVRSDSDNAQDAAKAAEQVAALPAERSDADPEDVTGSIADVPAETMPMEIGETSSTELPVTTNEEKPPVITPERVRPPRDRRSKASHRTRHAKAAAKPEPAAPFDIFQVLFGSWKFTPPDAGHTQAMRSIATQP